MVALEAHTKSSGPKPNLDHARNEEKGMQEIDRLIFCRGPLRRDTEYRRWYAVGGETCLVLTHRGRLLEPFPTFGPESYRVVAREASFPEADDYARRHAFPHLRECFPLRLR